MLQAYGGILALAITILYSFPLGVWDKFITSKQERFDRELVETRNSLSVISENFVEMARLSSSVSDPQLRIAATMTLQNRILLALTKQETSYLRFKDQLYPEEVMMIGIIYSSLMKQEKALEYFEYLTIRKDVEPLMRMDAYKAVAITRFVDSNVTDLKIGRESFARAISIAENSPNPTLLTMKAQVMADWAIMERSYGDWRCAEDKLARALKTLEQTGTRMAGVVQYVSVAGQQVMAIPIRNGQTGVGCKD